MRFLFDSQTAHIDGAIEVTSTSRTTAEVKPINLREPSPWTRLVFKPLVVDNSKEQENTVRGTIVYERKAKKDDLFPSERGADFISKQDVKTGDTLELNLDSSEVRALYKALQGLYQMSDDIGGIPSGYTTYVPLDGAARSLLEMLRRDPSSARMMISSEGTFDLVRELLKLLTQGVTHEELASALGGLASGSIQELTTGLNLEMLQRAVDDMETNIANGNEEYWQSAILEAYPWVISQLFSTPCMLFNSKAYVGGKALNNRGGNVVDFLYQNELTKNVSLVEIKTPCTRLLGQQYRGHSYSISSELSGAVTQVLSYRQTLANELASLQANSSAHFEAFSPNCIVVAGSIREFKDETGTMDRNKLSSFENFRNSLIGVSVVTFDELLQKTKDLVSILKLK